jgi:hypothetical protein
MYFTIYDDDYTPKGRLNTAIVQRIYLAQKKPEKTFYLRAGCNGNGYTISPQLEYTSALALYDAYSTYLFGEDIDTLFPEHLI